MPQENTEALHQLADQAVAAGQLDAALSLSAELVRLVPQDHRARTKLGLCLALAGELDAGVAALSLTATQLAEAGFLLTALSTAKDALSLSKDSQRLAPTLKILHAKLAESPAQGRPRLPPPTPPRAVDRTAPECLLELRGAALREQAIELSQRPAPQGRPPQPAPVPLLSQLSEAGLSTLLDGLVKQRLPAGATIVQEGEPGESMFILLSGAVKVQRGSPPVALARLGPGSLFGELSLVTDAPRSATVTAIEPSELFELRREVVDALASAQPDFAVQIARFARQRILQNLLRSAELLTGLDEPEALLSMFETRFCAADELLIREGQLGEGLYLLAQGQLRVSRLDKAGARAELALLEPGAAVGEISLLGDTPATADVRATSSCVILFLPKSAFERVLETYPAVWDQLIALAEDRQAKTSETIARSTLPISADAWVTEPEEP